MRIAHVTPEAVPVAKTGGLADVAGALPAAQAAAGHEVLVVMPLYRPGPHAPEGARPEGLTVHAGDFRLEVWRMEVGDVTYLLLDAPRLFARPGLYGTPDGDFPDNPIRFAAFARGAVLAVEQAGGGADVLHCHDWQAALVPQLLGRDPQLGGLGVGTPTVLTLHNLAYQGSFAPWVLQAADLPGELYTPEGFEFYGKVNYLKGGILAADALTTVSPTYAGEILTPRFGCGLEQVLASRRHRLTGILNGLDTTVWNPATDPHLERTYDAATATEGKAACRSALLRELGLAGDDPPVAGVVSRLVDQKGADLLAAAAEGILGLGFRLVMLGSGEPRHERALAEVAARYPGRMVLRTEFNDPLAHRIYAGADLFLMPSRFEPCGLGQLIALRYGTLPVVNPVGGLADTVRDLDVDPRAGNGFHMAAPTAEGLVRAMERALALLRDAAALAAVRRRAMAEDHGWAGPAREYEEVYREAGVG